MITAIRLNSEIKFVEMKSTKIVSFGDRLAVSVNGELLGLVKIHEEDDVALAQAVLSSVMRSVLGTEPFVDLRSVLDPLPSDSGVSGPTWLLMVQYVDGSSEEDIQSAVGKRLREATVSNGLASLHFE